MGMPSLCRALAVGASAAVMQTVPAASAQTSMSHCEFCPEMVRIPAGEFRMGSPPGDFDALQYERPLHEVRIKAFEISKYAVMFEQWDACVRERGCAHHPLDHGWGRGRQPVVDISWQDANQYVRWLSLKTGRAFRLPTEAEWEYAARGGRATVRYWGDRIDDNRANCDGCGSRWDNTRPAPGGSFAPNPFGLHDMLGNVWQWVQDCWHESYAGAPRDGDAWTRSGDCNERVARGGSWNYTRRFIRSAGRDRFDATLRFYDLGFRVARSIDASE
jgi:formylglycine-generating enzyme required for sulfatase activity